MVQALDKIRFESLTDKSKLDSEPELFIHLVPDRSNNTLSIIDSGIGFTKAGEFRTVNQMCLLCCWICNWASLSVFECPHLVLAWYRSCQQFGNYCSLRN